MNLRILVVEDDPNTRVALCELLEQDGHKCASAKDGREALSVFQSYSPDLVCLDVMMPHQSGYDLCRELRKTDSDLPIIFITAKAEEIDKVVGLELGADDYIVKPFGCQEVLARVRALARRCYGKQPAESTSASEFQMGELRVYPKKLRASRGPNSIELSQREVQLLSLLYEKRNEVVGRDEIFSVCWGYSHIPNSRTLDQMVSQLRSRIETDPKNPTIVKTVYGVGYRYEE